MWWLRRFTFAARFDPMLFHEPPNSFFTNSQPIGMKFSPYSRPAELAFAGGMNGFDVNQQGGSLSRLLGVIARPACMQLSCLFLLSFLRLLSNLFIKVPDCPMCWRNCRGKFIWGRAILLRKCDRK
jgi:hypothetical protein